MVLPSAHRKELKHAFTTLYKVKSEKQEVFFLPLVAESLLPREGSRGKRGDSPERLGMYRGVHLFPGTYG